MGIQSSEGFLDRPKRRKNIPGKGQVAWNVLECKECSTMFKNVSGKGWVAWNNKLRTEAVMSSGDKELALPKGSVS